MSYNIDYEEMLHLEKTYLTNQILDAEKRIAEINKELSEITSPKTQAEFDFRYQNNPVNED